MTKHAPGVVKAATQMKGLVGYLIDGVTEIQMAAIPGEEFSPLQVFAQTQRLTMAIEEIRSALNNLTEWETPS